MDVASDTNLLFAACLDGNLRIYNERLTLKSSMPWSNGTVSVLIYNKARKEVITAGSMGARVWDCDLDHEAYKNAKDLNPFDIPRTRDGKVVPWCFGLYQHARNRLNFSIPGSSGQRSLSWCDKVHLHEKCQVLFAISEGSIFGYELDKGTIVLRFQNLHPSPITTMAYLPSHEILVTSSVDSGGVVWRIAGGKPHRFKELGSSHLTIHHLAADNEESSLLSATGDGVVTLWSVETLMPIYKMKLPQLATKPTFLPANSDQKSPPSFFLHFDTDVKLFSIQNLYVGWMECNSEPRSLKQLSFSLILASFADSSVRILDSASTSPDKAAITTVPQLSTSSLLTASCSLSSGRLFTLLSNGSIHCWDLHIRGPPTFADAWTHLEREKCTCMEFLDGEAVSDELVRAWGLLIPPSSQGSKSKGTKDHLILGTSAGDVIVVSVQRKGLMVFRFPAYKYQAVEHLSLDYDRDILVTTSKTTCKVWSMAASDVKCKMTVEASSDVSSMELLEGRALFGTTSGSLLLLDIKTGRTVTSTSSDHMAMVNGIGASVHLQHFVTCSSDRCVKILDRDKVFKRSIYLAQHIGCCSFLNDSGDLLIGLGHRLVVVKADLYEFSSSKDSDDTSRSMARNTSIFLGLKGTGARSKALHRADHSIYRKALSSVDLPSYIKNMKANVIRHLAEEGNLVWKQEHSSSLERESIQRSTTLSLAVELRRIHSSHGKEAVAPPLPPIPSSPIPTPSTQKLPPILQGHIRQGSASLKEKPVSIPQPGRAELRVNSTIQWSQVLEKDSMHNIAVVEGESDDGSESDSYASKEEEGNDQDDQHEDGEASVEGSRETMEELARAAKIKEALEVYYQASASLAQRRRERREFLASGQDSSELRGMVETRFLLNLADEAVKQDRKLYGAPARVAEEVKARAPGGKYTGASNVSISHDGKAVMKVGELMVEVDEGDHPEPQAAGHTPFDGESVGEDMLHSIRLAAEAGHGLSAAFKKVLPVISSSSAFLEVDEAYGELKVRRTKLKRGLVKKKKKKKEPSATQHSPSGLVQESLPHPDGEVKKKKKKKKKKRKSRKAILESIDPARALALGQKDHGILEELKRMELHRMMTRQLPPGGSNAKIKAPPSPAQPLEDGRASAEPPDPLTLLSSLKDGWRQSLAFPASAPSKLSHSKGKQSDQSSARGSSLLLGTEQLNAVLSNLALKPHLSTPKETPIQGLKYNPRLLEDRKSSNSPVPAGADETGKRHTQLVQVPSKLIEEGMHLSLSRAMSPLDDEYAEAGIMGAGAIGGTTARALLLGHSEMKSRLMGEKSSAAMGKKVHLKSKETDRGRPAIGDEGVERVEREQSSISIFGRQRNLSHGDHSGLEAARKMKPLMMKTFAPQGRVGSGPSSPRRHFASQIESQDNS